MPFLVTSAGKRLVTRFGAVLGAAGAICSCACVAIIRVCGSYETCRHWCEQSLAPNTIYKYRARHCDCPCAGRLDYPPTRSFAWTGITFDTTGSYPDIDDVPEHKIFRIVEASTGSYSGTIINGSGEPLCSTADPATDFPENCDYDFNNDGDFLDPGETVAGGGGAGVGGRFSVTGETSSPCPTMVRYTGALATSANNPATTSTNENRIAHFDTGWIDRCQQIISVTAVPDAPWVSDPGSVILNAICRDCSGVLLGTDGDAAQICAYEYDVMVDLPDGPGGTLITHLYKLYNTIDNSWIGVDSDGNEGSIQPADSNPDDATVNCCGKHGLGDTTTDCPSCVCTACWKMILNLADHSQVTYLGWGSGEGGMQSCPGNWHKILGTTIDLTSAGFVGGCAP